MGNKSEKILSMLLQVTLTSFCVLAALPAFAEEDDKAQGLKICNDLQVETEGNQLLTNALEHIYHFPTVRHAILKLRQKGAEVCASGIPLQVDIYKNYRYFGQIRATHITGQVIANIPVAYTSPSVQADHNTHTKPWVAVSRSDLTLDLKKIMEEFSVASAYDGDDSHTSQGLLAFSKLQPWWSDEVEKTFSITPLGVHDNHVFYLGGWMQNVAPTASLYAQSSSPRMVIYRYNLNSKMLELSTEESAFNPVLVPLEDRLGESAAKAPSDPEAKSDYFIELGL